MHTRTLFASSIEPDSAFIIGLVTCHCTAQHLVATSTTQPGICRAVLCRIVHRQEARLLTVQWSLLVTRRPVGMPVLDGFSSVCSESSHLLCLKCEEFSSWLNACVESLLMHKGSVPRWMLQSQGVTAALLYLAGAALLWICGILLHCSNIDHSSVFLSRFSVWIKPSLVPFTFEKKLHCIAFH